MTWLIFVAITVFIDSIRIFIDNYVSDVYFKGKDAAAQKLLYGYLLIPFAIVTLIITGFDFDVTPLNVALTLFVGGLINGISGIFYYKTLEIDDSTNLGIFIQLAPVFYLVLGWLFLGETFSPLQLLGFAIIMAAPLIIVLSTRKKSRKIRIKAILYSFLYVFIAVVSNLIFIRGNDRTDASFVTTISIVLLGKGLADLLIVWCNPKWHRRWYQVVRRSRKKVFRPMLANFCVGTAKEFTYRAALATAPTVAIASVASDSSEPIVIFFMGLLLTLIWPKFGREKLNKKTIIVHLIATILVVTGIVILQK
jgi:drug/metabolite transporter (DMT)-like permease